MWDEIVKFLTDNRASLIANLVAGLVFFVLGPVVIGFSNRKFRKEKLNRAKDAFLDLLENMLVNKEGVTKEKLTTLFHAVSREHSVNLEVDTDLQYLLEDLSLRFAKSKHLSPAQKDEYSNRIEEIKKLLEKQPEPEERRMPKSYNRIFEELEATIDTGDKTIISKQLNELKEKLLDDKAIRGPVVAYSFLFKRMRENPIQFGIVIIIAILFYIFIILKITGKF